MALEGTLLVPRKVSSVPRERTPVHKDQDPTISPPFFPERRTPQSGKCGGAANPTYPKVINVAFYDTPEGRTEKQGPPRKAVLYMQNWLRHLCGNNTDALPSGEPCGGAAGLRFHILIGDSDLD